MVKDPSFSDATIRIATVADAEAITAIYNHYIEHTVVTFEEEPVSSTEMARRINQVTSTPLPWLVAELPEQIVGYAYATKWKERSAYRFSCEITVYLAQTQIGFGLGSKLYAQLLPLLVDAGIHVVVAGIALPNGASVALHEKFGLAKVAHFKDVGFKFGAWIDVGYWQRTL